MIQTIYGIVGMMLAMLFVFNQQSAILQEYEDMVQAEHEIMANGVALEVMEYVAGHLFDEAMDDEDFILEEDFDESDLAEPDKEYDKTYEEAQYVEHFNAVETTVQFQAGASVVNFEVAISVQYVNSGNAITSTRTDKKEVIVTVYNNNYSHYLVQHKRVLSPTVSLD